MYLLSCTDVSKFNIQLNYLIKNIYKYILHSRGISLLSDMIANWTGYKMIYAISGISRDWQFECQDLGKVRVSIR